MTAMETATRITGPCSCHEVYASRGLIAPDCAFHDMAREIAEALKEARREALEEAATVADRVYGKHVPTGPYAHMYDTPELESARDAATEIAKAIRALSPPVKDTK